jgi:hypothetical protein
MIAAWERVELGRIRRATNARSDSRVRILEERRSRERSRSWGMFCPIFIDVAAWFIDFTFTARRAA